MPVITPNKCKWCGTTDKVFLCSGCSKYTCGECLLYNDEEGHCQHKKFEPIESKTWTPEKWHEVI